MDVFFFKALIFSLQYRAIVANWYFYEAKMTLLRGPRRPPFSTSLAREGRAFRGDQKRGSSPCSCTLGFHLFLFFSEVVRQFFLLFQFFFFKFRLDADFNSPLEWKGDWISLG